MFGNNFLLLICRDGFVSLFSFVYFRLSSISLTVVHNKSIAIL